MDTSVSPLFLHAQRFERKNAHRTMVPLVQGIKVMDPRKCNATFCRAKIVNRQNIEIESQKFAESVSDLVTDDPRFPNVSFILTIKLWWREKSTVSVQFFLVFENPRYWFGMCEKNL